MGDVNHVVNQLLNLVASQKTVSTSKLAGFVHALEEAVEVEAKEMRKMRRELAKAAEAARKHKIAMQDYENLKAKNKRLKEEYKTLVLVQQNNRKAKG